MTYEQISAPLSGYASFRAGFDRDHQHAPRRIRAEVGPGTAYVDLPQDIGFGQTISDPYVVAAMPAALNLSPGANVLDVGTGLGYQAAVLARITGRVSSIELVPSLAVSAADRLRSLGFANGEVRSGDGSVG